jgi:hypothetical protein
MNRKIFIRHGIWITVVAIAFAFAETRSFGNHIVPQSAAEAITDMCSLLMCLTGIVLFTIGRALPEKKE